MSLATNNQAPDFALTDTLGNMVHLADFCKKQPVMLVFNRGFA